MANRKDEALQDRTDGDRANEGTRRAEEIEQGALRSTGHPTGGQGGARGDQMPVDMPANTDPQREQHTRKGQAQSPCELTHNEQPKKQVPGGRG